VVTGGFTQNLGASSSDPPHSSASLETSVFRVAFGSADKHNLASCLNDQHQSPRADACYQPSRTPAARTNAETEWSTSGS
jgi:hypothetical protein